MNREHRACGCTKPLLRTRTRNANFVNFAMWRLQRYKINVSLQGVMFL